MADEKDRPHERSLQGLLHMAIEAGSGSGSTHQAGQMSEERRQWLQEAMNSAFSGQVDEVQQMKECLKELSSDTSDKDGVERKEKALELLADLCENLDNASGLVREQEAGLADLVKLDGFSVLMRAMQTDILKLKIKSAFLLQNILISHPEYKSTLCSMGMIQQLVSLLRTEHSSFHEHVLSALCSMTTDFPQGIAECREPELAFEDFLRERCQMIQKQEEYQEELDYCERLLKMCFRDHSEDNGMDR
ncbi:hypothetical protein GDO78_020569 [Eleutherodactylus coqui]|uniref:Nucleotide exchange factor Fes1 domain-containing protein n=1 Tax=Eleutherodactylus coqui TaxID=57060 RepID=A0A8J6B4Q3_ELECQ|nr:hypothetical protein GDO78_020569 [Eleutherodactylus coqui]